MIIVNESIGNGWHLAIEIDGLVQKRPIHMSNEDMVFSQKTMGCHDAKIACIENHVGGTGGFRYYKLIRCRQWGFF